jgi:homoserine kinase
MNITIKVPATSANLGPGFDALGLALDLWNETRLSTDSSTDFLADERMGSTDFGAEERMRVTDGVTDARIKRMSVAVRGEGEGLLATNEKNLIVRVAQKLAERLGKTLPPFHAECRNQIPLSSGLGSSAATIVTGLLAGNALLGNPLSKEEILNLASEMEGHPDNVAPALLGGLVVSTVSEGKVTAHPVSLGMDVHITIALPDFYISTKQARAVLPKKISLKNAVHNISRAVLVTEAFRMGDFKLLGEAMTDQIHQPHRLKLIPGAQSALEAAREAGAAAVALSGAGPSLIAFSSTAEAGVGEAMKRAYEAAGLATRIFNLRASSRGAEIQVL